MKWLRGLVVAVACTALAPCPATAGEWHQSQGYWYYQDDAGNWYYEEDGNYYIWVNDRWELYPPWSRDSYSTSYEPSDSGYYYNAPSYGYSYSYPTYRYGYPYGYYGRGYYAPGLSFRFRFGDGRDGHDGRGGWSGGRGGWGGGGGGGGGRGGGGGGRGGGGGGRGR
jgi:hypothetical protein